VIPLRDNIPTRRFPALTVALIAINVFVFLFLQHPHGFSSVDESIVVRYGTIPYEITHPGKECDLSGGTVVCQGQQGVTGQPSKQPPTWITVLTSMFMHGGVLHIAGNMLFLWIFGNNIEDSMSRWRFVLFYLIGGLAAVAGQTVIDPNSTAPSIGASGAIAAVLGGYALLYPRARVVTLIFIIIFVTVIELPALLVLGVWFLLQLLSASAQPLSASTGVAYFAHIGGFAFGLLLIRLFANRVHTDYDRASRIPVY
jgi:membrane associated rhomboid family serine protease